MRFNVIIYLIGTEVFIMDKQKQQAMKIASEFVVYQESEQADLDAKEKKFREFDRQISIFSKKH